MKRYRLFIKNAPPTRQYIDIVNPYDGALLAKVEIANEQAIEQALKNAHAYYERTMKKMPAWERTNILYKVATLIKDNMEDLAMTIAQEGGKPLKDARIEAARAINTIKMSGDEALQLNGEQITMDRARGSESNIAFTIREPIGPVLAIGAFNHPLNLICHQIGTAIAAGNSVIAKPASSTPLCTLKLADYFQKAGLPDGALNIVVASGKAINAIVGDQRLRFVNFIGGENVGWELKKKVAPGVRVALEHGGTGSAIIDESAHLDSAIPSLIKGAFYHAGQVCVSVQNIYVHTSLYQVFLSKLKESVAELVVGKPTELRTDIGPLINANEVERIDSLVKKAVSKGSNILIGGKKMQNNCYAPTVLIDVNPKEDIVCEEVFGPILSVIPFKTLQTIIAQINKSRYSFQTAIYARNINAALYAAQNLSCTACIVNNSPAFRVDWMPFGGNKHSGMGTGGVKYSIRDMTQEKLIVINVK